MVAGRKMLKRQLGRQQVAALYAVYTTALCANIDMSGHIGHYIHSGAAAQTLGAV